MCGRYSIAVEGAVLKKRFGAVRTEAISPRYNAAPSQRLPVILNSDIRRIVALPWGLTPPWLRAKRHHGIINARVETLREKRTFENDLTQRRCLVLADGFYEWKKMPAGGKVPYRITLKDRSPFAFAGIWEPLRGDGEDAAGNFAIITTTPNRLMQPIHDRMPVILPPEDEKLWLSDNMSKRELLDILRPYEAGEMRAYEVSTLVNRASVDTPELIKPYHRSEAVAA